VPATHKLHPRVQRIMEDRRRMASGELGCDWGFAENLAYASLLAVNFHVRLIGQDSRRGTFFHRHAALLDQTTGDAFTPLAHVATDPRAFMIADSLLSEEAVLGFEYGYSTTTPDTLVIWEGQFGDFANGAQVVIDQFISSGEAKWGRLSGLTLFLPHGYEGQGPEHSSARLERFLQLCAEDNMQVANLTTPANYFHALRRQLKREFRKPLVLMTPKSLLRHKRAVSTIEQLGPDSTFHRLLWDDAEFLKGEKIKLVPDENIRRVVLCTGKVYYDLYEEREKRGIDDVYLLRVEQLYPFPAKALINELSRFRGAGVVWCQEEPKNMGSWTFVEPYLEWVLAQVDGEARRPRYVGRAAAAATASGLMAKHTAQLNAFLEEAFAE
jgi:2-oxoglutarate dehydrogenase E1 component